LRVVSIPGVPEPWVDWVQALQSFSAESWLWLVALSHLLEWLLIRADGLPGAYPIEMKRDGGRKVSGLLLKKGWPVPLILFSHGAWLPLPVFLGYARVNLSKLPRQQKRLASTLTFLYALCLCGWLAITNVWEGGIWLAAVLAIGGHEALYQWGRRLEKYKEPLFVSDEQGLKVLAVLPGTPAAAIGLKPGDIIQRFNGKNIHTMEELIGAATHASFCKLEVLDEHNDRHIMQKVLYEDDPRHLGVIGATPLGEKETVQAFQTASPSSEGA
jgi:hypothetical protein